MLFFRNQYPIGSLCTSQVFFSANYCNDLDEVEHFSLEKFSKGELFLVLNVTKTKTTYIVSFLTKSKIVKLLAWQIVDRIFVYETSTEETTTQKSLQSSRDPT
jgi:hypothetical protein